MKKMMILLAASMTLNVALLTTRFWPKNAEYTDDELGFVPVPKAAECLKEEHKMRRAGFGEQEIEAHRQKQIPTMLQAGFSKEEVAECYGVKE